MCAHQKNINPMLFHGTFSSSLCLHLMLAKRSTMLTRYLMFGVGQVALTVCQSFFGVHSCLVHLDSLWVHHCITLFTLCFTKNGIKYMYIHLHTFIYIYTHKCYNKNIYAIIKNIAALNLSNGNFQATAFGICWITLHCKGCYFVCWVERNQLNQRH